MWSEIFHHPNHKIVISSMELVSNPESRTKTPTKSTITHQRRSQTISETKIATNDTLVSIFIYNPDANE